MIGNVYVGLQIFHPHLLKQPIGIFSMVTPHRAMFIIYFMGTFKHSL